MQLLSWLFNSQAQEVHSNLDTSGAWTPPVLGHFKCSSALKIKCKYPGTLGNAVVILLILSHKIALLN